MTDFHLVAGGPRSPIDEFPSDVVGGDATADGQFWLRHLHAGLILYIAASVVSAVYLALTPSGPHRGVEWVMLAAALVATCGVIALPRQAIARSPRRLVFFGGWSVFSCWLIAAITAFDGGLDSPLDALIFIPLAYASLAYPGWLVATIGILAVVDTVIVGAAVGGTLSGVVVYGGVIAMVTSLAVLVAQSRAAARAAKDSMTERLVAMATHDGLTGCLTHRSFYERVTAEVNRACRYGRDVSLLIIDVDDFKHINDTYGHLTGDEVLHDIGQVISGAARPADAAGRIGGDEFALLLAETTAADATTVAARIQACTAALDVGFSLSVSVGIGHACSPCDGGSAQALVAAADAELYLRKQERHGLRETVRAPARV